MGVVATIKTALPFQNYMLPKHQHLVCFYSLCFSCFFCPFVLACFEQGLCYVYVSESEAYFVAKRRTELKAQDSDRTRVTPRIHIKY